MQTHIHKIGLNRGALRLWLEGKRLTDASFNAGASYALEVKPGHMALFQTENKASDGERLRRISGKAGKPIVDITGRDVAKAFPQGGKVLVTYREGFIEVVQASEEG